MNEVADLGAPQRSRGWALYKGKFGNSTSLRVRSCPLRAVHEGAKMTKRNTQAGQSLLMIAFSMVAFIAMMGLAIDMGYVRYMQRQLQTAADNGALAGAMQVPYAFAGGAGGSTPTSITTAAISG